jgi:hypothetical protein
MVLSWNEIKDRALNFSKEFENDTNEHAEAKTFMDKFFFVFGQDRRRIASFEEHIHKEDGKQGFIDLLWKGKLLIEFKSKGKDLNKAHKQAKDYFYGLKNTELPQYILVCDFNNFRLYDLDQDSIVEFTLEELVNNVHHFGFIAGYEKIVFTKQIPIDIKAAELMGKLHDSLEEIGYTGHSLEVYLVRILFCLFAEDTNIFNKQAFQNFITERTSIDGSDLAARLQELFQVLNTQEKSRFKNLDEQLAAFPYVNGKVFEEILPTASFDGKMRQALINCCSIDWSRISPAIFGSMFQSVMNPIERRNLGAHYTSESNILKVIKPLFLDDLRIEFENIKGNKSKLNEFHRKISRLKFLDPACGCGNFLIITYRELRLLELDVILAIYNDGQQVTDIYAITLLDVDMMNGIEQEEFPCRIAEVALWLIDHQMNMMVGSKFSQYFARLPLNKSANIIQGNALTIEWESVVPKNELSYIIGNPPFIGAAMKTVSQSEEMDFVFSNMAANGKLDYVAAWYYKAAQLIQNTKVKVGFVSTNSITQGEQVSTLWNELFCTLQISIHFAHRTFNWKNEARGNAAVHCVIIGFANFDSNNKWIFDYHDINGEPELIKAKNINAYLCDAPNNVISKMRIPICNTPVMIRGNIPYDDGNLLFDEDEKNEALQKEPTLAQFIKKYGGAFEMLNNQWRYCLWLQNVEPSELKKSSILMEKVKKCKAFRESSKTLSVSSKSSTPYLFGDIRQPKSRYILFPRVSSCKRKYLPIDYIDSDVILADSAYGLPNATLFMFGVLQSAMHNCWIRTIAGRLKSDYRYSNNLVYNNFPWPEKPNEKQIKSIEIAAQNVLDARLQFPKSSLAELYNPDTFQLPLLKAHNELDKAVDLAYRPQPFTNEANRMVFLFELYEKYMANLFTKEKPKKAKK